VNTVDLPDFQIDLEPNRVYMRQALIQARAALECDEVPVGAVIVLGQRIIAAAHNRREQLRDSTAHAEMIAITQASESIGDWRLEKCTLFVTLEPCPMCAGAIINARIPNVVIGAMDPKAGAAGSLINLLDDSRFNHRCRVVTGVLSNECGEILTEFFKQKRKLGKK
jgi:tRNA(adenine34) deaminase